MRVHVAGPQDSSWRCSDLGTPMALARVKTGRTYWCCHDARSSQSTMDLPRRSASKHAASHSGA